MPINMMLKASGFVSPAAVTKLRETYDDLLGKGILKPRGAHVTDVGVERLPDSLPLIEAVRQRLASHFPNLPPLMLDYAAYTRMVPGGQHRLHADAVKEDGTPNHTPWRVVSAVLYLGTSGVDFDGGEIDFPGADERIAPVAGLLIGFTTGWDFRHQVLPVVSGTRDAIIFWYMDADKQRNVPGSMLTPAAAEAAIQAVRAAPPDRPPGQPTVTRLPTPRALTYGTLQPRKKCKWEGIVRNPCTSCDKTVAEKNDERDCDHPEALQELCTRGNELSTLQSCWACKQWVDPDSTILIDQGASGIGDALLGLTAIAGLRAQQPDASIAYNVGESAIPFVRLFAGPSVVGKHATPHSSAPVAMHRQMNFNYHKERQGFETPRWVRYRENIVTDRSIIPPLLDPEGIQALGTAYEDRVLLFPRSHDINREWPIAHWINLEATLKAAGYKTTIMIPDDDLSAKRAAGLVGPIVSGLPADKLAGAMLNARVVVSNDSGPAHLAGLLGVPAIVVGGILDIEKIYGCYPTVRCLATQGHCRDIPPSRVYEYVSQRAPKPTDVVEPPMGGIEIVTRLHTWEGPQSPDVIFPDAISTVAAKIREAARTCTYDHRPFLHPADADIAAKLTEEFRAGYAAIKWAVSKVIQPKAICEIGVGGGLAALAMLDACPTAAYVGIDSCRYEDDLAVPLLGHVEEQFIKLKRHGRILRQDSKSLKKLPGEFDLVHVDGDHSFEYARHDLAMAFASGVPWILVDDARDNQVVAGIFTALYALRPGSTEWAMFEDTWTGSILIYTGRNRR